MKNRKVKLIIAYLCSAGLLAGYLYVLWLGLHPDVGREYRLYYLDGITKVMSPKGALTVRPGERRYLNGKENDVQTFAGIGRGWYWNYTGKGVENDGYCYTGEADNYLLFDFDEECTERENGIKINLHITKSSAKTVDVYADDATIGTYALNEDESLEVELPKEIVGHGEVIMNLHLANPEESIAVDYVEIN